MILRNIIALTLNDLAISFKNKTLFLVLFIPFFVFFSLKLVDNSNTEFKILKIGLIQNETYAPGILKAIESADKIFTVFLVSNDEDGKNRLKNKKIDGLLMASQKAPGSLVLLVLKKESLITLSIVENISALQKALQGTTVDWISDINALQDSSIQKQTLPTWILMLVLLVSFIIMPAQIAEEKEKKLLLALLQTPMREIEWLTAKLLLGMILIFISVLFLHLLSGLDFGNVLSYAAFIVVGGFCFTSYGIFLGFLCRNQASARTLGVIFYLPHLLPSALSDFSAKLTAVAPFVPSFHFYEPIRSVLLEQGSIVNQYPNLIYLTVVGFSTFFLAYLLMRKRWLM